MIHQQIKLLIYFGTKKRAISMFQLFNDGRQPNEWVFVLFNHLIFIIPRVFNAKQSINFLPYDKINTDQTIVWHFFNKHDFFSFILSILKKKHAQLPDRIPYDFLLHVKITNYNNVLQIASDNHRNC